MTIGKLRLPLLVIVSFAILSRDLRPAEADEAMSREKVEAIVGDYLKAHPDEIGATVKDYVLRHPEVFREILVELNRQKSGDAAQKTAQLPADRAQAIGAHMQDLYDSPHQVTLGDPHGDVTLVEFFDYNCGYCKRAVADTVALLGADSHVRFVLKEFPILGPRSVDAAQVAVAARMQDAQVSGLHGQQAAMGLDGARNVDLLAIAIGDFGFAKRGNTVADRVDGRTHGVQA